MPELGIIIRGESKNGKLVLDRAEQEALEKTLEQFPGKLELILRRPFQQRSLNQNKYYRGVVLPLIAEKTGDTPAAEHEHIKEQLLGGNCSTADLSKKEFEVFKDQIIAWAAQWDIIIPDPERVEIQKP